MSIKLKWYPKLTTDTMIFCVAFGGGIVCLLKQCSFCTEFYELNINNVVQIKKNVHTGDKESLNQCR